MTSELRDRPVRRLAEDHPTRRRRRRAWAACVLVAASCAVTRSANALARAQEPATEKPALEDRLRAQELAIEALKAEQDRLRAAPSSGYDKGFFLRSADGDFVFTLEGLLQVRATLLDPDGPGRESGFSLERMRFELGGEMYGMYRFHVEPRFFDDGVELEEAWIGADLARGGPLLMAGRMKEPFSLEEMLPRRHFDFPTFSILNQFVPAEDHGLTLAGGSLEGSIEYGAAVYNGSGGDDVNSDKDVAGRIVVRPWAHDEASPARGLQFGTAATFGRADRDLDGTDLVNEAKVPFLTFEPGARTDGERTRLGLEAAWLSGPLMLSAEAIHIREEAVGSLADVTPTTSGFYASASWVLTGESKSWRGVHPRDPLVFGPDGRTGHGALQVALRWSRLELDHELVEGGLVAPSSFPGTVDTWDAGLNWYATDNVKAMLHVLNTSYDEEIQLGSGSSRSDDALVLQLQIFF